MIIYRSSTLKTSFRATLFWMGLNAPNFTPWWVLYLGLKSYWKHCLEGICGNLGLKVNLNVLCLKGRWWTVGYALPQTSQSNSMEVSTSKLQNTKLLELARKQRMNTDVRKNVFLIMMTSEVNRKLELDYFCTCRKRICFGASLCYCFVFCLSVLFFMVCV